MQKIIFIVTIVISSTFYFSIDVFGQEIPNLQEDPFKVVEHQLNSGLHSSNADALQPTEVFRINVTQHSARWIRLVFDKFNLGNNSYILITSNVDDGWQKLDAENINRWGGSSAYFNGNAVNVSLHAAPGDKNIFFELKELKVGVPEHLGSNKLNSDTPISSYITATVPCVEGTNDMSEDTRVPSQDNAVGRVHHQTKWGRETGYLISNGGFLTAGHGVGLNTANTEIVQFNVPGAGSDGSTIHSHPNDQYPVDLSRLEYSASGTGNDWAIVGLFPNSNTGLTAAVAQGAFYRLAKDVTLSSSDLVRITGYGADVTPSGTGTQDSYGLCPNSNHKAQQTAVGNKHSTSNNWWRINTTASGGVSGAPLILEDIPNLSIGIQTHGFNSLLPGKALLEKSDVQRFSQPLLIDSIHEYPGSDVYYVDEAYPSNYGMGSQGEFFNPYLTVEDAVTAASSGGIVSMVKGHYPENLTITVNSGTLTLEAPVGSITIGGPGSSGKIAENSTPELTDTEIRKFSLSNNYPNPFNPTTVIEYTLREKINVELTIYDVLGRKVATLIDQIQRSGIHSVSWDASNLASGVYIYRIKAGDFVQSKKMLLMK